MKARSLLILALVVALPLIMIAPKLAYAVPTGDVNGDGIVNILDVAAAASQYKLQPTDLRYNQTIVDAVDFDGDGIVNIFDIVTQISFYGSIGP